MHSNCSMDFGRGVDIELVDFSLPADHPGISKVLGGRPAASPTVCVGGVLWASDSFPGTIYPPKARPADFVKYYTQQFNTIELNATHYRVPTAATLQRWCEVAPPHFKFCPKVHQSVSHADNLLAMAAYQAECNALFKTLGDRLGTVFLQLPPHFATNRLQELMAFLAQSAVPGMAVELRHASWFTDLPALNRLSNYLYKNSLGLVLTDTPGRRDVLHMRHTNKTAFVRFNAHNHFAGDRNRIDAWIARALQWFDLGLEEFYFFVHTPQQLFMPQLVDYFIECFQKRSGIDLQVPLSRPRFQQPQ